MQGEAEFIAIRCGRLIDGTGRPPETDVTLLIEGDHIKEVLRGREPILPAQTQEVDASGDTVMPGLMDLHVHLCSVLDPNEPHGLLALMGTPSPLLAFHAARNARLMLEAGFTTVRDVAGYFNWRNEEVVSLRRAIELGLVPGPRVYAGGWVSQTAGHLDLGLPPSWFRDRNERPDGPWEVRKVTRELFRLGVDLIKTSATGGSGYSGEANWWRNYTVEELACIADEAHAVGKTVAVHSWTSQGTRNAVTAGCDTVEHGTGLDEETAKIMADAGTFLIPTLMVRSERALTGRQAGGANQRSLRSQRESAANPGGSLQVAYQAGVKIATGTDTYRALRDHWGESAYELELMVRYGMTAMDAIVASTYTAAQALKIEAHLGTLEPDKWADLLVVRGDPLSDIRLLQQKELIRLVFKAGQVVVDRTTDTPVTRATAVR